MQYSILPPPITKPSRSSNLELYRILVMLLIIAHHYVVNSGIRMEMFREPLAWQTLFLQWFGAWGKMGINCFVLITGYFMCRTSITISKFLRLAMQVVFYSVSIYTIFVLLGYKDFELSEFVKAFLPVKTMSDDFVSCFIAFFLFIPFLNAMLHHISRKSHALLIILSLSLYTGLGSLRPAHVQFNYTTWFCVLYFISSYIRMHGFLSEFGWKRWGLISVTLLILSSTSVFLFTWNGMPPYRLLVDSNAPLAVATAFALFMFFKDVPLPQSRFINTAAASVFGVLLIHAHSDTMRQWLWRDLLDTPGQYGRDTLVLHALGSVLAVFLICAVIDHLRIALLEKPVFTHIERFLASRGWK